MIRHRRHFTLDRDPAPGDDTRVELPHPELFGVLHKGQRLLINDGKIRLQGDQGRCATRSSARPRSAG